MSLAELDKRKAIGLATVALYGLGLLICNTGREGVQAIGGYRSDPPKIGHLDAIFRFLTHPLMEVFADGMIAHSDFDEIPFRGDYQGTLLPGDPGAMARNNVWEYIFADTHWGLQRARVMGVDAEALKAQDRSARFYQYVFVEPEKMQAFKEGDDKKSLTRCTILIPINEQIRILIGNGPFVALLIDPETGLELPSRILPDPSSDETIHRSDPRFRWNTRLV